MLIAGPPLSFSALASYPLKEVASTNLPKQNNKKANYLFETILG